MNWIVLIVSGVMEAVWATALGASEGLSKPLPTVVWGMVTGTESVSFVRIALIAGLVGCVIGLKLVSEG